MFNALVASAMVKTYRRKYNSIIKDMEKELILEIKERASLGHQDLIKYYDNNSIESIFILDELVKRLVKKGFRASWEHALCYIRDGYNFIIVW